MSVELVNILKTDLIEIIEKHGGKINYVPRRSTPVTGNKAKAVMFLYNNLLYSGHLDVVGPACDEFPGEGIQLNLKFTGFRVIYLRYLQFINFIGDSKDKISLQFLDWFQFFLRAQQSS